MIGNWDNSNCIIALLPHNLKHGSDPSSFNSGYFPLYSGALATSNDTATLTNMGAGYGYSSTSGVIKFDGVTDMVDITNVPITWTTGTKYSYFMRVYVKSLASYKMFFSFSPNGNNFLYLHNDGAGHLWLNLRNDVSTSFSVATTTDIPQDEWITVGLIQSGAALNMYINGSEVSYDGSHEVFTGTGIWQGLTVGNYNYGAQTYSIDGDVAWFAMYSGVRSVANITADHNAGNDFYGLFAYTDNPGTNKFLGNLMMPDNYWVGSSGDYKWSTATNWSLGRVPVVGEDVYFSNSGQYDCVVDTNVSGINSITFSPNYSGDFTDGGKNITVVNGVTINTGGGFTASGLWTQTGNANFTITAATSWTTTAWDINLKGTGTLTNSVGTFDIHKLTCAASDKTTTLTSADYLQAVQWELGAGTFSLGGSSYFKLLCTGTNDLTFNASHTLNGGGYIQFRPNAAITLNLPKINGSGFTGSIYFLPLVSTGTITWSMQGNITLGSLAVRLYKATATTMVFNTNNYSISIVGNLLIGNTNGTGNTTFNFGSSTVNVDGYLETYNGGSSIIELDTSAWTIGGSCTLTSDITVNDTTTATWTFDGTAACAIESAGKTLPSLTFNKTVGAISISSVLTCVSISISVTNTSSFTDSGYAVTVSSTVSINSGGAFTASGTWTQTGDANFTLTSASTWTITNWRLDLQGSGILNNTSGGTRTFKKLTCSAAGKTTTIAANNEIVLTQLSVGAGILSIGPNLTMDMTAASDLSLNASHTITGTGAWSIKPFANGVTFNIPAINAAGHTGRIDFYSATGLGDNTFSLQGNITNGNVINIYKSTTKNFVVTSNNYSLTSAGGTCKWGNSNGTGTLTLNLGSSVIDINGAFETTTYNAGTTVLELDTSTWTLGGDCDIGTNTTLNDPTTCLGWTFDGTTALSLTSAGKTLPDLIFNKTVGAISLSDSLTCKSFSVSATNSSSITWAGFTVTTTLGCSLDGTGTYNLGAGITCNGASSTLYMNSTVSTVTASSCVLTFNGTTGMVLDIDKASITFKSIVLGASAIVTNSSGQDLIFNGGATTPLTLGASATFTVNTSITFARTTSGDFYSLGAGYTLNGSAVMIFSPFNTGLTVNMPALTYTGTSTWHGVLYGNLGYASTNIVITGSINFGTAGMVYVQSGTNVGTDALTINSGLTVTCAYLKMGESGSTNRTFTLNCNNAVLDINGYFETTTYNTGYTIIELDTSTWTISGDCDIGTNTTVNDPTTCVGWTFDGTGALSLTSAGKTLPNLTFNKTGGSSALSDALTCGNLTITSALNTATFTTTCGGDLTDNVGTTFNRLIMSKVTTRTITVAATKTLTLTNLTDTNLNGTLGALTQWRSGTPGNQFNVTIPAPITLTYQNPQDCVISQVTTVSDGTSVNGGNNNTNWIWPLAGTFVISWYYSMLESQKRKKINVY